MLVVVLAIALTILLLRDGEVPRVVLLPANTSLAPKRLAFDGWVPMSWAWYWRTKDFVLGHSRSVVIDATVASFPAQGVLPSFPPAIKSITNLHIYFVRTNEAVRMRQELTSSGGSYSTACRITTAHGIHTRMVSASGQPTSPSFSLEVLARQRGDCTDLLTSIEATGFGTGITTAITNLAMAARIQIPKEHALFILKTTERTGDPATLGVILTPKWK
ncbi:MAG TPA: hypothetical protein VJ063_20195 [Verrucomicrobiae bacterium]|nr:hypothetical protein [Verrucomicrobiae bacterium]